MLKPVNYFPHQTKHGYAPAFIQDGHIKVDDWHTSDALDACTAECTRRNREQIEGARKRLVEAQAYMDAVLAVFELGPRKDAA